MVSSRKNSFDTQCVVNNPYNSRNGEKDDEEIKSTEIVFEIVFSLYFCTQFFGFKYNTKVHKFLHPDG